MNEFFAIIFNWFSSLYDQDWDNFLYQGYYSYLGLILILFSVVLTAIFYFAPTVRFAGRGKWFLFMLATAVLVFLTAFGVSDYWANNATEEELPTIDVMNEIGTSFISCFWSVVSFCVFSLIMMNFSTYNKSVPFK